MEDPLTQRPQHRRKAGFAAAAIAVAIVAATFTAALLLCAGEGKAQETASGGSLSFFADEQDAPILLGRLNADPEIAFIVPDGPAAAGGPAAYGRAAAGRWSYRDVGGAL